MRRDERVNNRRRREGLLPQLTGTWHGLLALIVAVACLLAAGAASASCKHIVVNKKFIGFCEGGAHNPPETFCQVWSGTGGYGNGEFIAQGDLFTENCVVRFPDSPTDQTFCISRDDFTNKRGEEIWAFNVLVGDRGAGLNAGLHYVEGGTGRFAGVYGVLHITLKRLQEGTISGELCGFNDD